MNLFLAISEELDGLIAENNKYCATIKSELEVIESEVRKAQEKEKEEPETRIKDITFRALKAKFIEVLKDTQNTQIEYKTAVKGKISRQAKIIDPTLTNEQIEEVCNDPDVRDFFYESFLKTIRAPEDFWQIKCLVQVI